jgi:beta-xylosidase
MKLRLLLLAAVLLLYPVLGRAQNPVISTSFTPDPAPYVHGDKVYLFVDHDEDDATYFLMKDWLLYSTEDMVNWTYLGAQVSTATFDWAFQGDRAWASQAVEKDGKWYWYVCLTEAATRGDALAVAVADDPQGPWRDAIGGPLATGFSFIDPTVFIDNDGTPYLFWGNKGCWYGRLNDDMISFADGYKEVPGFHDPACFGPESIKMNWAKGKEEMMVGYEEGPWVTRKGDTYYMTYPAGGVPEHMAYSTAPTIDGPWTYRGRIMDEAENSFTIHGGEICFKGQYYMFYHNGMLPNGGGFHRSTCVEEFDLNPDGSIPFIPFTKEGPSPVGTIDPYKRVEAETMASSWGVKTDRNAGRNHYVTQIHNGDWIKVREVDFGDKPAQMVSVETLNFKNEGRIEFYLDELGGNAIARLDILGEYPVKTARIRGNVTGKHDLYILFRGGDEQLFDFDWWKFNDYVNMPVIQTKYTADPAPMVYDGTVYLYTTHDADESGPGFSMFDWLLYTSSDMVNWTDHGAVASLRNFSWYDGDNGAWALHVTERNGKFYMYCPIHGHGIGVLVADSPYGPFKDPLGEPLVWQKEHWEDIDPTVFIDDDGQAYMYWGNPNVYWAKLNPDMISLDGPVHKLDYKIEDYQEGPWFYKRGGHYYLAFASTCCPEGIGYAMSDSPTGPWEYKGPVMQHTQRTRGNHPGIIDFKGRSYVFGLNYDLMHIETFYHHERRSVSMAEMHYNPDGTIQEVPYWQDNFVEQLGTFDPYRKVEAETMAWGYGLKTGLLPDGICINDIDAGEHLLLKGVDFGRKGARSLSMSVRCGGSPASVEVRLDAPDGTLIGTLPVSDTRGVFKTLSCKLTGAPGIHDLYFVFSGGSGADLFEWDWWKMK